MRIVVADGRDGGEAPLRVWLTHLGYEVQPVADGVELLRACGTTAADLVICDAGAPEPDGFATAELRRRRTAVPIVSLSDRWPPRFAPARPPSARSGA